MDEDDVAADAEGEEIEEIDLPSFSSTAATLHACNLGALILQITSTGISYCDSSIDNAEVLQWRHEEGKKITLAASDDQHVILAIEGGSLLLCQVVDGKVVVVK